MLLGITCNCLSFQSLVFVYLTFSGTFFPVNLENVQGTLGFLFLLPQISFPPFCKACDLSFDGQHKGQELSERHTCAIEVIPAGKRGSTWAYTNACCCARVNTHFHMHLSYSAKSAQIHAVSTLSRAMLIFILVISPCL